jgi:myo-inositol-1(or 4)-monophosphatase
MTTPSPLIIGMIAAAESAAQSLRHDFARREKLVITSKGYADFVSEADRKAEHKIERILKKLEPDAAFLLEEGGAKGDHAAALKWVVDPLDGTANFLNGVPHWCISIALTHKSKPIAGIIYDPNRDELFWAEKGCGAWRGKTRLTVSSAQTLDIALTGIGGADRVKMLIPLWQAQNLVAREKHGLLLRRMGSAALDLAYVAAGRYALHWENSISAWDIAAGWLLVTEAGGKVTNHKGEPYILGMRDILATSKRLHKPAVLMLKEAYGLV